MSCRGRDGQRVVEVARATGADRRPLVRDRIAELFMRLKIMRLNAMRILSTQNDGELTREGMISKLYWATWHRDLGELAMDVLGTDADRVADADYGLNESQRLFLWSRCDTIYAGTNEIQRNIIGERALGLPREPRPAQEGK